MNLSRYLEVRKAVIDLAEFTANKKRMSYTAGNEDVLFNFKSDSEFVGNDPMQNVMTHLMKQIRGVASFVQHPDIEPSETLMSRAADIINYVTLMVAVAVDQNRTGIGLDHKKEAVASWSLPGHMSYLSTHVHDYNFGKDDV